MKKYFFVVIFLLLMEAVVFKLVGYPQNYPSQSETPNRDKSSIAMMNLTQNAEDYTESLGKIPQKYLFYTIFLCRTYNVPVNIVYNLVQTESQWKENVIGPVNTDGSRDYGLGQLNSKYLSWFKTKFLPKKSSFNALNGKENLEITVKYLAYLQYYMKDWQQTVASYNCGAITVLSGRAPQRSVEYAQQICLR